MASNETLSSRDLFFLASLFLVELSTAVVMKAIHMKGERPFDVFVSTRPGMAFLCAVVAVLIGGTVVLRRYLTNRRSPSPSFRLIVMMNLLTVVLTLIVGELAIRGVVRKDLGYEKVGKVVLKPNSWQAVKGYYNRLLDQEDGNRSSRLYVSDDLLGWTLGPDRYSAEGPYWSSIEGLRAFGPHVSIAGNSGQTDIALVGDSFTFGEEVRYQETYGYYLEQLMGAQFRVLNFGVPGYGLDQMLLRYQKDVRPWKPKIVILGFISDDVPRTLMIYPFLSRPDWKSPFSAPRFLLREEKLMPTNMPVVSPHAMFSRTSIKELPSLQYEKGYTPSDWQPRFYHASYLLRLALSWFPSWSVENADVSEEAAIALNAAILKAFVASVKQEGSIPLVLFLPTGRPLKEPPALASPGKLVLKRAGIEYIDPTSCLRGIDPTDLYRPKSHYSPQSNAATAKCISQVIEDVLSPAS
ncbi:MAG: SGNH/GDSL hydrolase family protein [Nitrospira sp. BO4]|jgi:hypothetical protein|nr:SGNH/GDSL hydrolase family protein [Nitrospira sp. BO4]